MTDSTPAATRWWRRRLTIACWTCDLLSHSLRCSCLGREFVPFQGRRRHPDTIVPRAARPLGVVQARAGLALVAHAVHRPSPSRLANTSSSPLDGDPFQGTLATASHDA